MVRFQKLMLLFLSVLFFLPEVWGGIPQELNRIVFLNETGHTITQMYYAPSPREGQPSQWSPDVLGIGNAIPHGQSLAFYVHYLETCQLFDIVAVDTLGYSYRYERVQVCNSEEPSIVITARNRIASRPVRNESVGRCLIENDTGRDIWFLFLSPSTFSMWGFDLLNDTSVFPDGDNVAVVVPLGDSTEIQLDMLAVDSDDELFYTRIELMESSEIRVRLSDYRER